MIDFRPTTNIPANAFKNDENPYAQILPMLLAGHQQAMDNRKAMLARGLFSDNPQLNQIAQVDPQAAITTYQQQQAQTVGQQERAAALSEKAREADSLRQIRQLQAETNRLMAQGQHEAAMAKVQEIQAAIQQRQQDNMMNARIKAESENAKHPFYNFFHSKPLVTVPGQEDTGGPIKVTNFKVTK